MLRTRPPARQPRQRSLRAAVQQSAFALLYGPAARFYDRFTGWLFLGEWTRWQQTAVPHLPAGGTVLELGCGTGALADRLRASGRHWIGIERSAAMTRTASRRLGPGTGLLRADAGRLPVASGSVAGVVATFPTRFILDPRVAAEVQRVLKPDAPLVIVLSGELRPHGLRRRARRIALGAFYGRRSGSEVGDFSLDGFAGRIERVPTDHGEATLYVGRRAVDGDQPPRRL